MPSMDNYPPGVTGNEPEITGLWPCDCGDNCEKVPTDCCDEQYVCETVSGSGLLSSDDSSIVTCAVGFGCAYDHDKFQHPTDEAEGLDLLAREERDCSDIPSWDGRSSELTTCLCCVEAQEITWSEKFRSYVHRDGTEATRWHVHYSEAHRDCDGLYERSWIDWGDDDADVRNEQHDVWTNAVQHLAFPFGYGTLTIVPREDDAVEPISATWDERTDEGYRSRRAALCHLACSLSQRSQRDHSAEAAGY